MIVRSPPRFHTKEGSSNYLSFFRENLIDLYANIWSRHSPGNPLVLVGSFRELLPPLLWENHRIVPYLFQLVTTQYLKNCPCFRSTTRKTWRVWSRFKLLQYFNFIPYVRCPEKKFRIFYLFDWVLLFLFSSWNFIIESFVVGSIDQQFRYFFFLKERT